MSSHSLSIKTIVKKVMTITRKNLFQYTVVLSFMLTQACHPSEIFDLTKMSWGDHDILTATSHQYFTATSF